jgi:general nucleoside transport system ATP-binding protein
MSDERGAGRGSAPPLVVMEDITKRFPGVVANEDVSLELRAGEVHALIGENGAGKSTLMRVLYGMYPPDAGRILVKGDEVRITSPRVAIQHGIGMVHQHFVLVDPFTVTENVILGDEGGSILDMDSANERVTELARTYGFTVRPSAVIEELSVGEEQRVEILKALYRGVDILILDEPTAVLTPLETKDLFANLRRLRDDGKGIVFISHKLDEVMEIADRITVLRRGRIVGETTPDQTSKAKLAEMMVGRPVLFRLEKPETEIGETVLSVEGLLGEGKLNGISLEVHAREILGVAGVEGNGQRELAESLIGLRRPAAGTIELAGQDIRGWSVAEIRNAGVAYIPEDRHEQGLVLDMSLWENAVLGREDDPPFAARWGLLFLRTIKQMAQRIVQLFDVRTRSIDVAARTLSGGNQQKLIIGRELDTSPKLLIASQPTRGLDVGAIEFVWKQILSQKEEGRGVLLISAELDEIYALSDRIVTLYEGRITGEYSPDAAPEEIGIGMLGGADEREAS